MKQIDLIVINQNLKIKKWNSGIIHYSDSNIRELNKSIEKSILKNPKGRLLIWGLQSVPPNEDLIISLCDNNAHIIHSGLKLGLDNLPISIDNITPNWMLNLNCDNNIESTSWRISINACIIDKDIIKRPDFFNPTMETLEYAGLECGYRLINSGAILRYSPDLLSEEFNSKFIEPNLKDEINFLNIHFNKFWNFWFLFRNLLNPIFNRRSLLVEWIKSSNSHKSNFNNVNFFPLSDKPLSIQKNSVSILIPTLNRYPYLKKLLSQIRNLKPKPLEVVIIDQSSKEYLDPNIYHEFSDLPLVIQFQDEPGQCTSRNWGLSKAKGEYILFIDDDDEIDDNLIQLHLENIVNNKIDVSCGVANEAGAGGLPANFKIKRISDVFPTNNTMIKKSVLYKSGLFDLAYNRGSRADSDLGTRIYLSGSTMLLNPNITVFHHRAPAGGLREHKARVITYASSRTNIFHRHIPSVTEIYKAKRYYTPRQVKELLWIFTFATLQTKGSPIKRVFKLIIGIGQIGDTLFKINRREKLAESWLSTYPKIPILKE